MASGDKQIGLLVSSGRWSILRFEVGPRRHQSASDREKPAIATGRSKKSSYRIERSKSAPIARNKVGAGIVATPWGMSDSLRDRRLRPGPGIPREDVAANQRERLFGALVASVAERGYAATTVGDLVEISGVSSRTFYDLFPDKQACYLAALEAIIQASLAFAALS